MRPDRTSETAAELVRRGWTSAGAMRPTTVRGGHPIGGHADAGAKPVPSGTRYVGERGEIARKAPTSPHKSARWILSALMDLSSSKHPDRPIDQYSWQDWSYDPDGDRWTYPNGGAYWVHYDGAPADEWHEGTKAEIVEWLAAWDVHPPTRKTSPKVDQNAPRGARNGFANLRKPVDGMERAGPAAVVAPVVELRPAAVGQHRRPLRVCTTIDRLAAGERSPRVLDSARAHLTRTDVTERNRARLAELLATVESAAV